MGKRAVRWAWVAGVAMGLGGCISESANDEPDPPAADAGPGDAAPAAGDAAPDAAPPAEDAGPEVDAMPIADAGTPPPPACDEEDDLAPNQQPADAVEAAPGFTRDDLYLCPETSDWFRISLEADQGITVVLLADPPETDLDLAITDTEGMVLTESAGQEGREQVEFVAPAAGTYLVRVDGFRDQTSAYALSIQSGCRLDGHCPADAFCDLYEGRCRPAPPRDCGDDATEPNDRSDAPAALEIGGATEGVLCRADRDWFAFEVEAGASVDLLAATDRGEDVDVFVLDADDGRLVAAALADARINPERLTLAHLPAGRYLVRLSLFIPEGQRDHEAAYRLEVVGRSGACTGDRDCANDAAPVCDAEAGVCRPVEAAGSVALGDRCGRDEDCAPGAEACWTGRPGGHDNFCTVTCEGHEDCAAMGEGATCQRVSRQAAICVPPCGSDVDCSEFHTCRAGVCEPRGECARDADCGEGEVCRATRFGRYCGLRPPRPACGADPGNDPNDFAAEATPVEPGGGPIEGLSICDADDDWYRVTVPAERAADVLVVTVTFRTGVDIDVYVHDAAGTPVGEAISPDRTEEVVELPYIAPGDYFVRVDQFASDRLEDTAYTLTIELREGEGGCTVEGGECDGTSPLRIVCQPETGACVPLEGGGAVGLGERCDSQDDCGEDADLCWVFEGGEGGRNICTIGCRGDGDCAAIEGTTCQQFQRGRIAVCLPARD